MWQRRFYLMAGFVAIALAATGFAGFLQSQFGYRSLHATDLPSISLIGPGRR